MFLISKYFQTNTVFTRINGFQQCALFNNSIWDVSIWQMKRYYTRELKLGMISEGFGVHISMTILRGSVFYGHSVFKSSL